MKFQVLCMTDDHLVIRKTMLTWFCATRIVVLANGINKHLIKEQLNDIKNCRVLLGEFTGFSETRNLLVDLSQTQNFDYNIMIDDSFELHGDILTELEKQTLNHGLIRVKSGNFTQNRKLIFKNGRYSGYIHETLIEDSPTFQIENVFIEDIIYTHHLKRTHERVDYDLLMLEKEEQTRRTRYYKATLLLKKGLVKESLVIFNELLDTNDQYYFLAKKCCDIINAN